MRGSIEYWKDYGFNREAGLHSNPSSTTYYLYNFEGKIEIIIPSWITWLKESENQPKRYQKQTNKYMENSIGLLNWEIQIVGIPSALVEAKKSNAMIENLKTSA